MNVFIGVDNGVSGSFGVITEENYYFKKTADFTQKETDYTKAVKYVHLIDPRLLGQWLSRWKGQNIHAMIERPMVNPSRWRATLSAMRCLEATRVVFLLLGIPQVFLDSKEWQNLLLPSGLVGPAALKRASVSVASRMFPKFEEMFRKHKDADGMLIAEHCRRQFKSGE